MRDPSSNTPSRQGWRWVVIGAAVATPLWLFAYIGGWLTPHRLTPQRIVDALQNNSGVHPGYRRNHAKGVCVAGYFESSGMAAVYSTAKVFGEGRTQVIGRFAIAGGNPGAPENSTPVRSFALQFTQPDGQQWRTGMNNMPVFVVSTPQDFYELALAGSPDPRTGKPDPAKLGAFFGSHPETAAFLKWAKSTKPSTSYAADTYYGLDAFYFINASGQRHAVRWQVVPDAANGEDTGASAAGNDELASDLAQRLSRGPLRWHLKVTLAAPNDPTNDATKAWPADRMNIDAGTVVIESLQPQENGPCRDINYDPTILPAGIRISDDPLLAARSAAYADSYLRRTTEEAHVPGTTSAKRENQR